jgi:uncharacterized protein (DUF433 family)
MSTLAEVKEALPRLTESERYDLLRDLAAAVPNIVKTPGVCGGEAFFLRTRIPVWMVVRARQLGVSEGGVLESYPALTAEDLVHATTTRAPMRGRSRKPSQRTRRIEISAQW